MKEKLLRMAKISESNTNCDLCIYCKYQEDCPQEIIIFDGKNKKIYNSKIISFCSDWEEEE